MSDKDITEGSKVSVVVLWGIVIGVIAVCGFLYSIKSDVSSVRSEMKEQTAAITAHSDNNLAVLKQSITEQYETQASHKIDIDSMSAWNKTLSQGQRDLSDKVDKNNVEQRLAIQHVEDKLDNIATKQAATHGLN